MAGWALAAAFGGVAARWTAGAAGAVGAGVFAAPGEGLTGMGWAGADGPDEG
ncbi:hypothetical protein [Streptomyces sp. NPDC006691]|uniref:hypothetical protein n=1 Tax=Streptomyces sp. NPDC006691 TaxID=3364757 RepID=UPI0036883209